MGRPEMAGKHKNPVTYVGCRRRLLRPDPAGRKFVSVWSSGRPPLPWPACVQWWWPESAPTTETRSA